MNKKVFYFALFALLSANTVSAHVAINSSPTTACNALDSTDLTTHTSNQIDSRLALSSALTGLSMFSSEPLSTSTPWVRNSSSWTTKVTALDFTGVSPWNTDSGYMHYTHGATLISLVVS